MHIPSAHYHILILRCRTVGKLLRQCNRQITHILLQSILLNALRPKVHINSIQWLTGSKQFPVVSIYTAPFGQNNSIFNNGVHLAHLTPLLTLVGKYNFSGRKYYCASHHQQQCCNNKSVSSQNGFSVSVGLFLHNSSFYLYEFYKQVHWQFQVPDLPAPPFSLSDSGGSAPSGPMIYSATQT